MTLTVMRIGNPTRLAEETGGVTELDVVVVAVVVELEVERGEIVREAIETEMEPLEEGGPPPALLFRDTDVFEAGDANVGVSLLVTEPLEEVR
ncbi:hypothetical protein CTA1_6886 [Colletotrichum tanaceti]|uniref:Uncharacterized protein n=1 Tax=Colletotrichum tanaceti TaxID=1306861 RepID=A0A4U6XMB5_9PEZI|nr:hypothetical protein CTA1_6886 [Colletotrichum tanaceti]